MRKAFFAALCVVVASQGAAVPASFPSHATYLFFVEGKYAGKSEITVSEENGAIVFTSTMEVGFREFANALSCRTELEGKTLRARLFRYEGTRGGGSMTGLVRVEGDSVSGEFEADGTPYSSGTRWVDPTFLFQNYVPEHLIVLSRHLLGSNESFIRFNLLLPSDMMAVPGIATMESEIELATRPSPSVCRKYAVSFQNSAPFFLYVDPKRGVPVYIDFPSALTETFLESAYGEHPTLKYRPMDDSEGGP